MPRAGHPRVRRAAAAREWGGHPPLATANGIFQRPLQGVWPKVSAPLGLRLKEVQVGGSRAVASPLERGPQRADLLLGRRKGDEAPAGQRTMHCAELGCECLPRGGGQDIALEGFQRLEAIVIANPLRQGTQQSAATAARSVPPKRNESRTGRGARATAADSDWWRGRRRHARQTTHRNCLWRRGWWSCKCRLTRSPLGGSWDRVWTLNQPKGGAHIAPPRWGPSESSERD